MPVQIKSENATLHSLWQSAVCVCVFLESVFELSSRRSLAFGAGVERAEAWVREISAPARICLIDSAAHCSKHTSSLTRGQDAFKNTPAAAPSLMLSGKNRAQKHLLGISAAQTTGINADCLFSTIKRLLENREWNSQSARKDKHKKNMDQSQGFIWDVITKNAIFLIYHIQFNSFTESKQLLYFMKNRKLKLQGHLAIKLIACDKSI